MISLILFCLFVPLVSIVSGYYDCNQDQYLDFEAFYKTIHYPSKDYKISKPFLTFAVPLGKGIDFNLIREFIHSNTDFNRGMTKNEILFVLDGFEKYRNQFGINLFRYILIKRYELTYLLIDHPSAVTDEFMVSFDIDEYNRYLKKW